VETLNLMLERWIEESGIPAMQLGGLNSEFGIRNLAISPSTIRKDDAKNSVAAVVKTRFNVTADRGTARNSEFRIPNSEFV
jgi:hypothetical protein